jgi:mono/diheme cytochrome c family protein
MALAARLDGSARECDASATMRAFPVQLVRLVAAFVCVLVATAIPRLAAQEPTVPIGAVVDAPFTDLRWQTRRLPELGESKATVLFFASIECPLVQRYLPRIGEMAKAYAARGVVFVVVNVGAGDEFVDAVGDVTTKAPAAVFARDFDLQLAKACGVDRTGAAVVLDAARRLVYRGRVDDQHGYSGMRDRATKNELRDALDAVLAGQPVATAESAISGCKITPRSKPAPAVVPTYAKDVAPILHRHCVACHRPGGEAPFALLDEAQAKKHAAMIGEVVAQGRMPVWYGSSVHGSFRNHRRMPPAERDTLLAWIDGGMPSGDARELPPPPALPTGTWRIGEPDQVLSMKAPIRLPAEGTVPYQYVILPFQFQEDTWIEAIEIKPDNERVLHHCNLARVKFGESFSQDGFITGYVPGGDPMVLDPGHAVRIPKGSALALQAHYVTTGQNEVDKLRVGLRFPRVPVQKEVKVAIVADFRFAIPPGAMAHPVKAQRTLKEDALGIGMFVHMHLRGRDMLVTADRNGERQTLLLVPNYNFDWQQSYRWHFGQVRFPRGTRIEALAHYDNSAWNPFNPDPTATVRFGLETTDEMHYLFLFWVGEHEALDLRVDPKKGHALPATPAAR